MSTRKFHLLLLLLCALTTAVVYGQAKQNQPDKAVGNIKKDEVSDAISKASENNPESIYFVEQLALARAVQAVPMLERKFVHTQDVIDKAHIASALVRLGDKDDAYWEFLVKQATLAVESDAPDFMNLDPQAETSAGPSPEFTAWANARKLDVQEAGGDAMYRLPGRIMLLSSTGDRRAIPLLRQGLLSPNHQIEYSAALGLAELQDKDSIPFILQACKIAPEAVAPAIAESLVYFDDPEAQKAVDTYVPKERARILREGKAAGKNSPF